MSYIVSKTGPSASDVRAWGREQNASGADFKGTEPGTRGRLNPALVAAYNKAHKGANAFKGNKAHVSSVTVTAKPAKGRAVTKRVNVAEARAALAAQGIAVGKRGRLPKAALTGLILQG